MAYDASRAFLDAFEPTPDDATIISAFGFYAETGTVVVMPRAQEGKASPTPVTFVAVVNAPLYIRDFAISRFMTATDATGLVAFGPT